MAAKASRKPLSRERVLAAAVALADAEGIQSLTMRRLAADSMSGPCRSTITCPPGRRCSTASPRP